MKSPIISVFLFSIGICSVSGFTAPAKAYILKHPIATCHLKTNDSPIVVKSNLSITRSLDFPKIGMKFALYAESDKNKGVYARPSAAIEKGSGFYVPGLEGSRVRILFGIFVLLLTYVNNLLGLGDSNADAVAFSQNLVVFYGTLLLFQGMIEFAKENGLGLDVNVNTEKRGGDAIAKTSASAKQLNQIISNELKQDEEMEEKIRWVAASFVALTAATHVLLLEENGKVLYSLGNSFPSGVDGIAIESGIDTVYKSKGGRVSVPDSHPSATLLPEGNRRCILLQQVEIDGSRRCLMVGSDQLLAAFTKNDLKWLGSLSDYLQ